MEASPHQRSLIYTGEAGGTLYVAVVPQTSSPTVTNKKHRSSPSTSGGKSVDGTTSSYSTKK